MKNAQGSDQKQARLKRHTKANIFQFPFHFLSGKKPAFKNVKKKTEFLATPSECNQFLIFMCTVYQIFIYKKKNQ